MKRWFHPAKSCLPVLMATFAMACGGTGPAGSEGAQELARQQWELTPIAGNPAGRPNYVVAIGYLNDTASPFTNNVRIGTYAFNSSTQQVSARLYSWTQSSAPSPRRVTTGNVPDSTCSDPATSGTQALQADILVSNGFRAGDAPNDVRTGNFQVYRDDTSGRSFVNIQWPCSGCSWSEEWWIEPMADGKYVRLDFKYGNRASHGYAYGSNAALSERRAMSSVQAHGDMRYGFTSWNRGVLGGQGAATFAGSYFKNCSTTTNILTMKQAMSTACNPDAPIHYYLLRVGSADRRDAHWMWCQNVNYGANGNSHVFPQYQVLDDNNNFRGYVQVEASFHNSSSSACSSSDERYCDMLRIGHYYE
jgi:hypothetical protein